MATLSKFLAVFLIVAIILAILLFLFMPRFFYNLNVKDGWKSWTDKRYQLFVFVHKRFRKAMACGQVYERFVDETLRIYNKDNFQKEKSEFDNNKMMNNLVILSEILDDEGFVRKHMTGDSFSYEKYRAMMTEWNQKPIFQKKSDNRPFAWPNTDEKKPPMLRLSEEERKQKGSFQKLIQDTKLAKGIYECISQILVSSNDGEEYIALLFSIKKYKLIQFHSWIEIYDCINSSFDPGIKIQYNAIVAQIAKYERGNCKEDAHDRIENLTEEFLKKLDEIQ